MLFNMLWFFPPSSNTQTLRRFKMELIPQTPH
jgi:hypothetical protein